ncbi:hypothetical protein KM043_000848 [Ampulex compressa]|nr:hypothetical protein KM043_000848 [Ampulex compressa]
MLEPTRGQIRGRSADYRVAGVYSRGKRAESSGLKATRASLPFDARNERRAARKDSGEETIIRLRRGSVVGEAERRKILSPVLALPRAEGSDRGASAANPGSRLIVTSVPRARHPLQPAPRTVHLSR